MVDVPYPKHEKALSIARSDLRKGVREYPDGSNTGKRIRHMQGHTWLGGTGWPWCVAACICWAEEAGFTLPYQGAGAYQFFDWAKSAGWTCTAGQAIPGDFVVFNIGAGHMGMLEYPVSGRTVSTIDGNSSNKVKRNARDISTVRGYIHLPEKVSMPKAKPPLYEVVTSESGHKVIYASTARGIAKKLPQFLKKYAKITIRRRK